MLGSPAGPGGPSQRGGLWPIAPVTAPTTASFTTDGLNKYGIYSLFPGTPNFGNALYSHSTIGRFTSGSLQSSPTTFHATHKDSVFSSGYTFGAPTPPPGSPYSPVPVTQLELFAKGFNSNIIIQQPEYPLSPKKTPFTENKQPQQRCEEKCCSPMKPAQKPCMCSSSPSSTTSLAGAKTKFVENASGCSRTNPVDWSPVCVKKEPGTPCQVPEITTSVSPVVKIEVTSPTSHKHGFHHDIHNSCAPPIVTTNGNIPVGIAVARQRIQQHDIVSSPSLPPAGLLTTVNTSTHIKEMSRLSEIDSTPGMAANTSGGVHGSGGTLMQCTDDRTTGLAGWPMGGAHSSALTAPTLWQYPASLPMEPLVPMSVPIPPVGFQLVRDPNIGGLLLLPSTESLHQAVVWPSYHQPSSHVLLPQIPPPPLQLLSSASSDYLSSSTTLHQHTQTHSTRLVAVTTDTKRKIPLPIPATTLIKIETDATTLDQTKTLQAVSTIASNTATVFTDQNVAPLVTTHVIYQHPTNLILSQTPAPETACRSQATSPVTCLTPPPENNPQNEEESLGVQDASNQTESPICSEDDATIHATILEETKSKHEELPVDTIKNQEDELPINKVPEKIEEPHEIPPKTVEHAQIITESNENDAAKSQLASYTPVEQFQEETHEEEIKPDSTQEKIQENINFKPDLSGLELLSSIVEFENCRKSIEKIQIKQEVQEPKIEVEQNEEVLKGMAHMTLKDHEIDLLPKKSEPDTFGGLDLLCALAEQRILEEVTEKNKLEAVIRDKEERDRQERKKEKRKSRKHSDEPKHKRSKYSYDENNIKIRHSDKKSRRHYSADTIEYNDRIESINHSSNEINKNQCSCRADDTYRTYKTRESEEEVKKFIASKSQPLCCKGDWPCMNPNELDMRKKLADLQRKYREKQMELHKLKVKKYSDCPKKSKSKKKSFHSDKDRETPPPPLLDKMDVPLKPNKNNQELLRPPTLSAYSNEDIKSNKIEEELEDMEMNNTEDFIEEIPMKRCYTPSIDLSDSTPEKVASSSKKRKVGRPKKLLTSSGLRTGTETIVAKKPKKGNIVGYLLAAKEKLMQSKNGQLYSNSPPRFVEETTTTTTTTSIATPTPTPSPKHKSSRSKSEDTHVKKKHDKKNEKCKIRPKLKAEPMVKKFVEEEELHHEWSKEIITVEAEPEETEQPVVNEEVKEEEEPVEEEVPVVKDERCILTAEHLDTDKLRVLTAMGGLFYAGHLNAVEPPDVYSITLDGERGNRPHIMSREEILRDAIVEVAPSSTEELLVGTRICAYWSQQYRCLYPGSVAEPGTPDPALDSKFVSVEFDDGDSGRIALEDIRLLPPDYPIIEYDPNPLLSLSKRRRRTSTAEDKQRANQASVLASAATSLPAIQEMPNKHQDVEKENKDTNKGDSDSHRERKRLKKRKKEKLKQKLLLHEDKKKKKKHKCSGEENCKHKKHHKKHRKHKKHHHSKDEGEEKKFEETNEVAEIEENEDDAEENDEEQQDSFEENTDEFPEYHIIANPEDEVTMDDILEDKKKKSKKIRDRQESCESRSKMSAFLPARQLWGWSGKGYRRPKAKGRTRKQFFKAIQRGKETIQVGDSAVFLSTGRPDRPYIGKIEAMWEACGTMVVKVKWFYHPEETIGCPLNLQYPGALFESPHVDENDVQTISHKCEVLPLHEYTEKLGDDPQGYATIYDNNDIYYLAGYYDPTTTSLKIEPNIPFSNAD